MSMHCTAMRAPLSDDEAISAAAAAGHGYRDTGAHACMVGRHVDMHVDRCADVWVDMWLNTGMRVDKYVDVCVAECVDMRVDI